MARLSKHNGNADSSVCSDPKETRMHTLYTIGYQQCSLADFIGLLQQAGMSVWM